MYIMYMYITALNIKKQSTVYCSIIKIRLLNRNLFAFIITLNKMVN